MSRDNIIEMKSTEVKSIDELESSDNSRIVNDQEIMAVKRLLKNEPVAHKLGLNGEYEILTTLTVNKRTWRASCRVRCNGVERVEFPLLTTDRSQHIRHLSDVSEALHTEFIKEAVKAHFDRLNTVKDHIELQKERSSLEPNIKRFVLLSIFFLIAASLGGWFLFREKIRFFTQPAPIKPEIIYYKCNRQEPCDVVLPFKDASFTKEIKVIQENNLPKWLTFDPNRPGFSGNVPPDQANRLYVFKIRIQKKHANERLLQVNLKIDGQLTPHAGKPSVETSSDFQNIDEGYLQDLLDKQGN